MLRTRRAPHRSPAPRRAPATMSALLACATTSSTPANRSAPSAPRAMLRTRRAPGQSRAPTSTQPACAGPTSGAVLFMTAGSALTSAFMRSQPIPPSSAVSQMMLTNAVTTCAWPPSMPSTQVRTRSARCGLTRGTPARRRGATSARPITRSAPNTTRTRSRLTLTLTLTRTRT